MTQKVAHRLKREKVPKSAYQRTQSTPDISEWADAIATTCTQTAKLNELTFYIMITYIISIPNLIVSSYSITSSMKQGSIKNPT